MPIKELDIAMPNKIIGNSVKYGISLNDNECCGTVPQETIDAIDILTVQCYDNGQKYEDNYDQFVKEIDFFLKQGFSKSQIAMGLPFYGYTNGHWQWGYKGLYGNRIGESTALINAKDNEYIYYFDDVSMIKRKTYKVMEDNIGGIMNWSLELDLPYDHPASLLRAIVTTMETQPLTTNLALLALNKATRQSSGSTVSQTAASAVDGNKNSSSRTFKEFESWWQVDLGEIVNIVDIKVYNQAVYSDRLSNYHIFVSNVPFTSTTIADTRSQIGVSDFYNIDQAGLPTIQSVGRQGRYVRIQLESNNTLNPQANLKREPK